MKGKHRYKCNDCEREFLSDRTPEQAGFGCIGGVWLKRPEPEGGLTLMLYKFIGIGIQCPDCEGRDIGYVGESMDISDYDIDDSSVAIEEEINKTYSDYIQSPERKDRIKNISKHDISQILVGQMIQEESYISVLYKVMKLLNDKENEDLGIENDNFIIFLKNIGINSLESIWSALIGLGAVSTVGLITTARIKRFNKEEKIKVSHDLDELEVLIKFLIKQKNAAESEQEMVQTDKKIRRKYKKEFVNKMLEIKREFSKRWYGLMSTGGTIPVFSEKAVKELVDKLNKKIKV